MTEQEKSILEQVANHPEGLLYPVLIFNVIGEHKRNKEIHKLISEGYIEEIPYPTPSGKMVTGYRASEKGHSVFYSPIKKAWYFLRGDVRTAIFSIITSVITALIVTIISNNNSQ